MWFYKEESTNCEASEEDTIEEYGETTYSAITTTKGSSPPPDGGSWFDQKFVPAPLQFDLSFIVNLFTDEIIDRQNFLSREWDKYYIYAKRLLVSFFFFLLFILLLSKKYFFSHQYVGLSGLFVSLPVCVAYCAQCAHFEPIHEFLCEISTDLKAVED